MRAAVSLRSYATMKGAIVQLARNCAYDFAKYNIRSNSVCAGTIETPISVEERKVSAAARRPPPLLHAHCASCQRPRAKTSPMMQAHGWSYEEWQALKTKDVMLGRVGHVREVANATLFFACAESSYCTGTHLMVDGGQTPCTTMGV